MRRALQSEGELIEGDVAFLKRMMAELRQHSATHPGVDAAQGAEPAMISIAAADLERLVKLYAGIPGTAMLVQSGIAGQNSPVPKGGRDRTSK